MKTIIFATQNQGKVKEIKKILEDLDVEVLTMTEAGIDIDIEENGTTFEENAVIKAEALKAYSDCIILADDSGLEIDYLDKAPGVYSARYMGKDTPYEEKNQKILDILKDVPDEKRTARFVCAIAAAGKGIETMTTLGTIEGYIGHQAAGGHGFGYDPIFYVNEYHISTAQLNPEVKNTISHRGKALRLMKEKLMMLIGE
ncbi:MAG: XTP/dITP diphosphatase [Cellulosilyticaceae bacterium]